jgi:hypothetical protein
MCDGDAGIVWLQPAVRKDGKQTVIHNSSLIENRSLKRKWDLFLSKCYTIDKELQTFLCRIHVYKSLSMKNNPFHTALDMEHAIKSNGAKNDVVV